MTLKGLLKKKDKSKSDDATQKPAVSSPTVPQFEFYRTTTTTRESIEPPSFPGDPSPFLSPEPRGFKGRFRRHSNAAAASSGTQDGAKSDHRPHFGRHRSASSVNVPQNLPEIAGTGPAANDEDEAKWEKRATMLVEGNPVLKTPGSPPANAGSKSKNPNEISAPDDVDIQEAIRLHEAGNFEASTKLFAKLADPNGPNNALSQVLYGLALRHGWGCEADMAQAVRFLSMAASNSAEVERLALNAGLKKGGAAKGELVLAIFELGNCFRYGWGTKMDPVAAKQYYETAANLGDTDAMNEVAWCYLEGFGTKKDKYKAAQFLRRAEEKGSKTLGNSWIWKDKYGPKT